MDARQARLVADKLEPSLRRAFLDAFRQLETVSIRRLEQAVASGNVDGVMAVLGLSAGAFTPLMEAIRAVYISTGELELRTINQPRGRKLAIRFNGTNPGAQAYLLTESSRKVVEILDDQRLLIRRVLEDGMRAGRNPRSTALDLAGRIVDGRRQGGIIELTSHQAGYVDAMRAELSNPATASRYFRRDRRDARFDRVVKTAIAEGRPVAQADIDRIATRYSDRLLQLRAETIARTETIGAMNAASGQAMEQLIADENLPRERIMKIWRASADERTRESHAQLNGEFLPLNEPFITIDNAAIMRPGDPAAPPEEVINCRCWLEHRVDWAGMANG